MEARIVVVDNDGGMRDLFTHALKRDGWQVASYTYAHIDEVTLEQYFPDLIILDFNLRDEGVSWEFLQLLKMGDTTAKIPILITTTASHLPAEVQDYLLTCYINVIRKPFDLKTFLKLVHKTLALANQAGEIFFGDRSLPILLFDDTDNLWDTTTTVLRLEGHRVVTVYDDLVAMDLVSRGDYCLILLNIAMPLRSGYAFLAAYEKQLRPHSPVIILSAEPDIQSRHLPSFVVDVLRKPFEIGQLLSLVGKFAQSTTIP